MLHLIKKELLFNNKRRERAAAVLVKGRKEEFLDARSLNQAVAVAVAAVAKKRKKKKKVAFSGSVEKVNQVAINKKKLITMSNESLLFYQFSTKWTPTPAGSRSR